MPGAFFQTFDEGRHESPAYTNIEMTRERSRISFNSIVKFPLLLITFSLDNVVDAFAIRMFLSRSEFVFSVTVEARFTNPLA